MISDANWPFINKIPFPETWSPNLCIYASFTTLSVYILLYVIFISFCAPSILWYPPFFRSNNPSKERPPSPGIPSSESRVSQQQLQLIAVIWLDSTRNQLRLIEMFLLVGGRSSRVSRLMINEISLLINWKVNKSVYSCWAALLGLRNPPALIRITCRVLLQSTNNNKIILLAIWECPGRIGQTQRPADGYPSGGLSTVR